MPGCTSSVGLAAKVAVQCSSKPGCDSGCAQSKFVQRVFARYEARLSGGGAPPPAPPPGAKIVHQGDQELAQPEQATRVLQDHGQRYWWRLNNSNCNLHDMTDVHCAVADGPEGCKHTCEAHPDCGGFLFYTKTGSMAAKNLTCWSDIGPLPPSDDGDDLFIMHDVPEPPPVPTTDSVLSTVEVCVTTVAEDLGPDTDESYVLSVPVGSAATTVTAKTIFGAMHGLESLTQLVDVRVGAGQPTTIPIAPVHIEDKPRFPFRGLMIDSGRHFLPISHVKKTVVAASMVKLNVIHWHLVDSQSFATCSDNFPALCEQGAYPNGYSASEAESSPTRNVSKARYSFRALATTPI